MCLSNNISDLNQRSLNVDSTTSPKLSTIHKSTFIENYFVDSKASLENDLTLLFLVKKDFFHIKTILFRNKIKQIAALSLLLRLNFGLRLYGVLVNVSLE